MPIERPPRFLVVIQLARTALELATTAEHALAILKNETVLSGKAAKVFDVDGKRVKAADLERVVKRLQEDQPD
jgi:hypothetical protein